MRWSRTPSGPWLTVSARSSSRDLARAWPWAHGSGGGKSPAHLAGESRPGLPLGSRLIRENGALRPEARGDSVRRLWVVAVSGSGHQAVVGELAEWWEDVRDRGIGTRLVLLAVPRGWGRSHVLNEFGAWVEDCDDPLVFSVVPGCPVGRAVQAEQLRAALTVASGSRAARLLGLDSVAGDVQLGLGVGGLFASGLVMAVPLLAASLAVTAAGNAWDGSPAGQQGAVARTARAVARVSVAAPVLVLVDDAELLDADLAAAMAENLLGRVDGQVLVVAAVTPGSTVEARLLDPARYELLGRVHRADADPDMSHGARLRLAREITQGLTDAAVQRIARRTRTLGEVFQVAAADRLADVAGEPEAVVLALVDAVVDAVAQRPVPSVEAQVLAWAGGVLHVRQADRALEVLGAARQDADPWVSRSGGLARVADPASPRLAEQVAALASATRRRLVAVLLDEAVRLASDPGAGPVERVIARQAVHRTRRDLDPSRASALTQVQRMLIRGLEQLADPAAAYEVAAMALAEMPDDDQHAHDRAELLGAVLRLDRTRPRHEDDPLIGEALALARSGGAVLGLEARVWAAVDLLNRPGQRDAALKLADQVASDLVRQPRLGEAVGQWRLLLAFHAGKAGFPAISQALLSPLITTGTTRQQEAAQAVLYAIGGPHADTRLQIILLETELGSTPPGSESELLRLHHTLAADYQTLGDPLSALHHAQDELPLSNKLQGPDHPETLATRYNIATLTWECGDAAQALRLARELLPDQVRVLGPHHPDILATRHNIAALTFEYGDAAQALRLARELLPDEVRVLGPDHPEILASRNNIATMTGECGDAAQALRLLRELLPDMVRVLGPDHPDILATRHNIARLTFECGDAAQALRLARELLPDQVRVLGPDHPEALKTRNTIAGLIGQCGTPRKRCAWPASCFPTGCGCWAPTTPRSWPPGTTSPA